jgi:Kelch motif
MKRYLSVLIVIILFLSCKKEKSNPAPPNKTSTNVFTVDFNLSENENVTSFSLNGSLQVTSTTQDIEYGFIFSSFSNPSIYQGKVIGIGKSQKSLEFTYTLTGLDTGKTYYCRSYALLNGNVIYSPITAVGKIAPSITDISTGSSDTTANTTVFSLITNLKNLSSSDQVIISLDNNPLTITSTNSTSSNTTFITLNKGQLTAGAHVFNIKINNINISYIKKITLPPGKWTKVGQMSYAQLLFSTLTYGFVKDNWIYSYRLLPMAYPAVTTTQFIKQNIQTGQVVQLSTYGTNALFLLDQGIAITGNQVHFIGGEENDSTGIFCVNAHYVYDINTDTWTKEVDFPGSVRQNAVTLVYNNKIYYGLGYKIPDPNNHNSYETERNDMWSYDLQTKQWQKMTDFLQGGRIHNTAFSIGSKVYVVGGYDSRTPEQSTWCYDAQTNAWSQKADFPGAGFENAASFQTGQYGYVGLGTKGPYSGGDPTVSFNFFRYDPTYDQWTQIPDLLYSSQYPIYGLDGKYGIIAGGFDPYTTEQDIYTYTP